MTGPDELLSGDVVEHTATGRRGRVRDLRQRRGRTPEALVRFDTEPAGPIWIVRPVLHRIDP